MAHITTCNFCGRRSVNYDHDECAEGFGQPIEADILDHYRRSPNVPLPAKIAQAIASKEWGYYLYYLKRKAEQLAIKAHAEAIRLRVASEVEGILTLPDSQDRINKHNVPLNHQTFHVTTEVRVTVTPTIRVA